MNIIYHLLAVSYSFPFLSVISPALPFFNLFSLHLHILSYVPLPSGQLFFKLLSHFSYWCLSIWSTLWILVYIIDITLILRGIMLKIGKTIHQEFLAIHFQRNFWNQSSCVVNLNINSADVGFSGGIRMELFLEAWRVMRTDPIHCLWPCKYLQGWMFFFSGQTITIFDDFSLARLRADFDN